jgi:diaminohydroxyphosphoribosylaminopyrimidine deaminase/5-amino-6-(5-phosphoribosylamino)uracil reductase
MNKVGDKDSQYMRLAIDLAKKGRFLTGSNPNVGCVIVKDEQIIGQGWHQRYGEAHAEVNAINDAHTCTKGATAYVTLEPCSHFGKTSPCVNSLINNGISRVVIATLDPNPLVSGQGVIRLEQAGITVISGVETIAAKALNEDYFCRQERKIPWCTVKLAISLDGKIGLENGKSKWITDTAARADVQSRRAVSCAILSTAATVIADNASLTVRHDELPELIRLELQSELLRQPVRVILDRTLTLKEQPDLNIFFQQESKVIIVTSNADQQEWDLPNHISMLAIPFENGKADLVQLWQKLAEQGINSIWVESGAQLASEIIRLELADELLIYQAPKLLGQAAKSMFHCETLVDLSSCYEFDLIDVMALGNGIKTMYRKKILS